MRAALLVVILGCGASAPPAPLARSLPTSEPAPPIEQPDADKPPFTTQVGVKLHRDFATLRVELTNSSSREQCLLFRTGDEDVDLQLLAASFGNETVGAFPLAQRPPKTCLAPGETVIVAGRTKILSGCGSELDVHYSSVSDAVARACPTCWRGAIDFGRVIIPPVKTMPCP